MRSHQNSGSDLNEISTLDDDTPMEGVLEGDDDTDVVRLDGEMSHILEGAIEAEISDEEAGPSDDSVEVLQAHSKDAFCIDVTEKWIATGGEDDTAAIFKVDLKEKQPVLHLKHKDSVTCVKFNSTGSLLATGDMSGQIIITDLSNMSLRCEMDDCSDLEWVEWHFAADVLFAGSGDGVIWMYLIGPKGIVQTKTFVSSIGAGCTVGKLLGDGKRLLAGYANGSVLIWSLKESSAIIVVNASDSGCTTADVHFGHNWAVVGTENGRCITINTLSNSQISELTLKPELEKDNETGSTGISSDDHKQSVECAQFCQLKSWVAIASNQDQLGVYEVGGTPRHILLHDGQLVVKCLWGDDGNTLISACLDGNIRLWDARSGKLMKCLSGAGEEIYDLAFRSNTIYSVSSGGHLRIFPVQ